MPTRQYILLDSTENKQKIAVRIQNLNTSELYSARTAHSCG